MDKYSVLMSIYYKEKPEYLSLAIDSMINQTIPPDEIVLVEDGPLTDELYVVIDEYIEKYTDLIHIVVNETNLGLGIALNNGLKHCKNELIARMDTDDVSLPKRCEEQLSIFKTNSHMDIVGGDITEFIDDEDNIVGRRSVPQCDKEIKEYMKYRCALNHVSVMFKKQTVLAVGGYKDWFWNEDYYLWIRMLENGCMFANTGTVLVNVRTGSDMYSRRGGRKYFESEKKLQDYMLEKGIINNSTYFLNVLKRWIVQVLLPNSVRGWVFRKFARN